MPIKIHQISNYDQIIIKKKSLVILDIDETILKFDGFDNQWWEDQKKIYKDEVYNIWINNITNKDPILLDQELLFKLIKIIEDTNSKLIIVTARLEENRELTKQHLEKCQIKINNRDIYFTKQKGDIIYKLLINKYINYKNIIFVDDLQKNIDDIKDSLDNLQDKSIDLYKITHINL
jgi:predicted secreted acid phosphatase